MFMRGTMEKENESTSRIVPVDLEWKVDAIVETDSKKFAAELQRVLNENTVQGYIVSSMLTRNEKDLVLIQQRRPLRQEQVEQSLQGQAVKGVN